MDVSRFRWFLLVKGTEVTSSFSWYPIHSYFKNMKQTKCIFCLKNDMERTIFRLDYLVFNFKCSLFKFKCLEMKSESDTWTSATNSTFLPIFLKKQPAFMNPAICVRRNKRGFTDCLSDYRPCS